MNHLSIQTNPHHISHLYPQSKHLQLELIRKLVDQSYIFAIDPKTAFDTAQKTEGTPMDKLFVYGDILDETGELNAALKTAHARISFVHIGWQLACFVLALAGTYGLMSSQILNFFYLLIAFLGWHTITLLWWLIRPKNDILFSFIGQILDKILPNWADNDQDLSTRLIQKNPLADTAKKVIANANAPIRHWQFAKLIHQGWLATLIGTLLAMFVLFLSKSYLFVWESTLLTQATIAKLTHLIATPLTIFGFHLPTQGELMAGNFPPKSLAILLMACVVVYGVLPRSLACGWAVWQVCRHRFVINPTAYFFENLLRQFNQTITDPNDYVAPSTHPVSRYTQNGKRLVATLELASHHNWSTHWTNEYINAGNLEQKADFERLAARINQEKLPVLLGIDTRLLPDRGLAKKVTWLAQTAEFGLMVALIDTGEHRQQWEEFLTQHKIEFGINS